jgi:hypothetical protein
MGRTLVPALDDSGKFAYRFGIGSAHSYRFELNFSVRVGGASVPQ